MTEFKALKELRNRVWPLAVKENLATDMTGVSVPILHFQSDSSAHPYQVIFLLYYAVPDEADIRLPYWITRPYARVTFDMQSGELVDTQNLERGQEGNSLIGPSVSKEILDLPDPKRRMLQELFFLRFDEAAKTYASDNISDVQREHLADLLNLFESLSEPPIREDYENYGRTFFSWLRQNANDNEAT